MKATLHTDGGARGNPGPAGIGAVLRTAEGEIYQFSEYVGVATNNQAEYLALKKGIIEALTHNIQELECYLDSELIVKQLQGVYRIKHQQLKPLAEEIRRLAQQFDHISFVHIPREKNKEADYLVNKILDEIAKKGL